MILKIKYGNQIVEIPFCGYRILDFNFEREDGKYIPYLTNVELNINLIILSKDRVDALDSSIKRLLNISSVKIEIKNIRKYIFTLVFTGKLGDIFGAINNLQVSENFQTENYTLSNDINLIKFLLGREDRNRDFNLSDCLVIRFISEENANLNPSSVFDILRSDFSKPELRKFLLEVFNLVYGYEFSKARVIGDDMDDKMNLDNIKENVVDGIRMAVEDRLGGGDIVPPWGFGDDNDI